MRGNLLFVGIDVDDKAFHTSVVDAKGSEITTFQCKPLARRLTEKLAAFAAKTDLRICYEATYIGFSLQRALTKAGYQCEVVASSLIPMLPGKKVKTDRIDCQKLARFYAQGLLTPVTIPDEELESDRCLLRSHAFIVSQVRRVKNHVVSYTKRLGWSFEEETGLKSRWTKSYRVWLDRKIATLTTRSTKTSLIRLLNLLRTMESTCQDFSLEVGSLAGLPRYDKAAKALQCIRGIETTTALTLLTEIGDIRRFAHPKKLVSFAGLDVREYSSGGKERKQGITKMGNVHIRRVTVEASQFALQPPRISYRLATRREQSTSQMCAIGDRCMDRLHKKSTKLLYRDKPRNKIKTACAREMLGFIWEIMNKAA